MGGSTDRRDCLIVAVFGSDDESTRAPAEAIGAAIGRRGHVLLTGGRGPGLGTVKERAISGAERAHEQGHLAPWVGVPKEPVPPRSDGRSLVLPPHVSDKRNYLEASVCDVAVAFDGGVGTASEVTFCLALGRPVVLVGAGWAGSYPCVPGSPAVLVDQAAERVRDDATDQSPLGRAISDAYRRLRDGQVRSAHACVPLPPVQACGDVVDEAVRLAAGDRPGAFPALGGLEDVKARFDAWIAGVQERLR